MLKQKARLLVDCRCQLGEGVQWNPSLQRLFFTDIHGREFLSVDADGNDLVRLPLHERLCSFAFDADNRLIAAFESGLFVADSFRDLASSRRISHFEPEHASSRYNDGRCDRVGRFWVGGMDENDLAPTSTLTSFDSGSVRVVFGDIGCTNSLCFSPTGDRMYFADTSVGVIWLFDYDQATGVPSNKRVFVERHGAPGAPDGSCVDSSGNVWNARFNGSCVAQFSIDGTLTAVIELPVPQVTCVCIGGPQLDRLYITTARENMSAALVKDFPSSGGLFVATSPVSGLAESQSASLAAL